jgi:hypothetical protein
MDIVALGLWAAIGVGLVRRRRPVRRATAVATVAMAVMPDVLQLVPMIAWVVFGSGTLGDLTAYTFATPGTEPAVPPLVASLTHHLHCIPHSAVVALPVSALALWRSADIFALPLAGWWSHIVIDVFTHSADYYPSPVFYPITMWGFHGIAWNAPWFMVANYAVLVAVFAWLAATRRSG